MREPATLSIEPSPLPALGDVLEFLRLIWAVDHGLQRSSKRMEITMGVAGSLRLVIRIVGRFPGIPAGHLARLLHIHPGTLTGIIKRLERLDLVRRRPDPRDARRALIGLTDKGRLFDVDTAGTIESSLRAVLQNTPPMKLQAACEVLEAVVACLSDSRGLNQADQGPTLSKADA